MKLALRGFRGYSSDSEFIDFSDINIFIGKNSSGKSTLLKFFQIISKAFEKVHVFSDLIGLEINLANTQIGGSQNSLHSKKINQVELIFETVFEFYYGIHKVKFAFFVGSNDIMILENITIHDDQDGLWKEDLFKISKGDKDLKEESALFTYRMNGIRTNIYRLLKKYQDNIPIQNYLELKYLLSKWNNHYKNDNKSEKKKIQKLYNDLSKIENTRDVINKFFIPAAHSNALSFAITKQEKLVFDFKHPDHFGVTALYNDYELDLDLNADDINYILNYNDDDDGRYDYQIEDIDAYFSKLKINPNTNIVKEITKIFYQSYSSSFSYDKMLDLVPTNLLLRKMTSEKDRDEFEFDIDFAHLRRKCLSTKGKVIRGLVDNSRKIFELKILEHVNQFRNIQFLESNKITKQRNYNTYNTSDVNSKFLHWYINNKETPVSRKFDFHLSSHKQKTIGDSCLEFINKFLRIFELGSAIEIIYHENLAKIQIHKSSGKFELSDEGTGQNKLISQILGLSMLLDYEEKYDVFIHPVDFRFIVMEEPERNLHPDLQSKLAYLFVELVDKYNCRLLIETHSEYFIRKLQVLVAEKKIKADRISINYFTMHDGIETIKLEILKDGSLSSKFGEGFFDVHESITQMLFEHNIEEN